MTKTTSRARVLCTLDHRSPDRIPVDLGATFVSGIHVSCVLALRDYFGLENKDLMSGRRHGLHHMGSDEPRRSSH